MTEVSVVHLCARRTRMAARLALRLRFPTGARAKLGYTAHPVPQLRPSGLAGRKPCAPLPSAPWPAGIVGGRRCQRLQQTRHKRSEEHTSELQSQSNIVCRLLLEKKKIH